MYAECINRKLNTIEKYITIFKEHYKRDYPNRCQRSNRLKHRKSNSEQSTSELWVSISCTNIVIWNPRRRRQISRRKMENIFELIINIIWGLPWWLSGKESTCNAGDVGSIPGSGRSSGEGNGNPLQCSCLRNPMDSGAWQAIVHVVANSWLSDSTTTHFLKQCICAS